MRSDIHDDDEEPTQTEVFLELDGKVEARTIYKQEASAELSKFKVLLELKGVGSEVGRLGVDLVTVLDTSGSMRGERLAKMKIAMEFLVKKLGHNDRLSVVSFNRRGEKLCPLRQINDVSREAIIDQVRDLTARGTTNTESGLQLALKILENRRYTQKRGGAIMLMSDGMEDAGSSNAASVPVSSVPVYTFAFGRDSDHQVLSHIAENSNGGMFAAVPDSDSLNVAFSMALAGLLHVAIDDLTLTIAPKNGSQLMVDAGNYPVKRDTESLLDPVTIIFGTLYDRETRKVLLTLSEVEDHLAVDITYTYRVGGEYTESGEKIVNVSRKNVSTEADNAEVLAEERRVETVSKMREARKLAGQKKIEQARKELVDAKALLSEVDAILTAQLDQLFLFMISQETYDIEGRAFALALEASHGAQRAVILPAGVPGMFNTPLMDLFIEQAREFDNDPTIEVPTEEEDNRIAALVH